MRVGVVGYGTIGKRVADAVLRTSDMQLTGGVAKTSPDYEAAIAMRRGIPLYAVPGREEAFRSSGIEVRGTISDLVSKSDVVIDATRTGGWGGRRIRASTTLDGGRYSRGGRGGLRGRGKLQRVGQLR